MMSMTTYQKSLSATTAKVLDMSLNTVAQKPPLASNVDTEDTENLKKMQTTR